MTVPVERVVPGPGELGCLLLHGLTGTSTEMQPVAAALAGRYPLWVARIAGHETTVADLAATSWHDWFASAAAGADALRTTTRRIVPIGLSTGALLAMRLAASRPDDVAGMILLSPAIALRRRAVRLLRGPLRTLAAFDARIGPLQRALARLVIAKRGSDISDVDVRASHPGYQALPFRALLNLLALQKTAWRDAPTLRQPALVVHATQDHTCPVGAATALHARLGSTTKRLVILEESFHVVTVDRERARVMREIVSFLAGLGPDATLRQPH